MVGIRDHSKFSIISRACATLHSRHAELNNPNFEASQSQLAVPGYMAASGVTVKHLLKLKNQLISFKHMSFFSLHIRDSPKSLRPLVCILSTNSPRQPGFLTMFRSRENRSTMEHLVDWGQPHPQKPNGYKKKKTASTSWMFQMKLFNGEEDTVPLGRPVRQAHSDEGPAALQPAGQRRELGDHLPAAPRIHGPADGRPQMFGRHI